MVVNIQFTPLYGVRTDHLAISYLLSIDGFNVLLDCGWNSSFDPGYLANLATVAPKVHVVLLSHPDIAHLGALPYAVAKLGLDAPIFSTLPVWRMGQMFMYDAFLSLDAQSPFDLFNLDHVDAAFEIAPQADGAPRYRLLKYQQHFPLDFLEKGKNIVITPHAAGHMLGGTVWNIKKDMESIVYAVDFNHRRERHLNPTTLASFDRPSHLIIGAGRAATSADTKKSSDIISKVKSVVTKGGNVLIPVDTAGRIIELAVNLHDAWGNDRDLAQVPLVILHDLSTRTFEFARSMIEWMSDEVVKRFDVSRENMFVFKHVKLCQSLRALDGFLNPMVVLASSISMEIGFSRELFVRWCENPKNAVILVDRPEPGTLYSRLFDHCTADKGSREAWSLDLILRRKEFLQGEELQRWREAEQERISKEREEERLKEEAAQKAEGNAQHERNHSEDLKEALGSTVNLQTENLNDSELSMPGSSHTDFLSDPKRYDEYIIAQLKRLGAVSEPSVEVFPFSETERPSWDHYGQIIDTTRFMIGEDPGDGAPARPSDGNIGDAEHGAKEDQEDENIPTKYVEEKLAVVVSCQLLQFDNAGLADGDSLKRIVKEVEPRHVTVVAGTVEATDHFSAYLRSNLVGASRRTVSAKENAGIENYQFVVSPGSLETVDITSHTSVLEFQLDDSLTSNMSWHQVGAASIGFMEGRVSDNPTKSGKSLLASSEPSLDCDADEMEIDSERYNAGVEESKEGRVLGHPTIYVGTVMLNRMKDVVIQAGMKAEFAGGALCIENPNTGVVVLLKKVATQQVVIEGAFSEEYMNVRDLLYKELVIP